MDEEHGEDYSDPSGTRRWEAVIRICRIEERRHDAAASSVLMNRVRWRMGSVCGRLVPEAIKAATRTPLNVAGLGKLIWTDAGGKVHP